LGALRADEKPGELEPIMGTTHSISLALGRDRSKTGKGFLLAGNHNYPLVEMAVIIITLVILCAVMAFSTARFVDSSKGPVAAAELHDVQIAVAAAMSQESITAIEGGALNSSHDLQIGDSEVGAYLKGGTAKLRGSYQVNGEGTISQIAYP
jgi:hypothetical protein